MIMGIYRPPSTNLETFFDKLADLFDATASIGGHKIFTGDLNCPGDSSETIDARLSALLSCYNVVAVNSGPTYLHSDCGRSMLDLIIESEESRRLAPATATTTGFSDHSLLTTRLQCTNLPTQKVTHTYRNFRHMDATAFRLSMRHTASFTTPSSDPDIAAEQLTRDLKAVLERYAPLKSRTTRLGSSDMRWMTPKAVSARKERRRMKRRYARTKSDEDRKNFRVLCRRPID